MGANVRSTVGTATDANAMLRVIFSRVGQPHIGGPQASSFNVPSVSGAGAIAIQRGSGTTESRSFSVAGGMCPRCEGMGNASDIDLAQLYDEGARRGRDHRPRLYGRWVVDADVQRVRLPDPDKPIRDYTKAELQDFLYKEPTKVRTTSINLTYEGLCRGSMKSSSEGRRRAAAAHPGLRRAGSDVQRLSGLRRHPAQRGGQVIQDRGHQHRRRLRHADQRPGRVGARPG